VLHDLAPQLFNGLVLGAFYAIVALGLSLIMNLTGTINMAHGSFMTLAGYLAYSLVLRGTSFWFALLAAPLIAVIVGVAGGGGRGGAGEPPPPVFISVE